MLFRLDRESSTLFSKLIAKLVLIFCVFIDHIFLILFMILQFPRLTPTQQTTPSGSGQGGGGGRGGSRERTSTKRDKKSQNSSGHAHHHSPSHASQSGSDSRASSRRSGSGQSDQATPIRRTHSRDDLPNDTDEPAATSVHAPPTTTTRGSPQLLRRHNSREEIASPNPETGELNFSTPNQLGVRRESVEFSPRNNWGSTSVKGSVSTEGVVKAERSPEIVIQDDVSGSSMSTSSFDSIQLLDVSSPPHLILKAMENPE